MKIADTEPLVLFFFFDMLSSEKDMCLLCRCVLSYLYPFVPDQSRSQDMSIFEIRLSTNVIVLKAGFEGNMKARSIKAVRQLILMGPHPTVFKGEFKYKAFFFSTADRTGAQVSSDDRNLK